MELILGTIQLKYRGMAGDGVRKMGGVILYSVGDKKLFKNFEVRI